jgi:murein DD-endopeptidase MepM/ murein hydrolase activator NlpD
VVRNFPRATRRRMAAALAVGSLLVGVAAVPFASADGLNDKKHKVEKHLHSANQDLDESSSQLRAAIASWHRAQQQLGVARGHLSTTRGELAGAEVLDHQMQAKLDAAANRLLQARSDLAVGRTKITAGEKTLGQIVVQNYQTGDPSLMGLSMVLTSQDPTELTGQLNSVQNVLDMQTATLDRLQADKVLLIVQEKEVQAAEVEVGKKRESAAENLVTKQRLEAQAAAEETQVQQLVGARAQAKHQAATARAHDLAVLHRLKRQDARISALLKRRAAAARRRAGGVGSSLASHGFLSWPLRGPITSPYGWRINPITGARSLHDGIDIGVACGTPIHAPASGRVLQEYFQTAWGNRLIMDLGYHRGVGLAVILNHMSGYVAHTGDYVRRGQVVGYSGTTGWSTGCHLHFTVMVNGVAVDPMGWL